MVKAVKANVSFNGVELSKLDIDNLRLFESELISEIIRHNDELKNAEKCNAQTIIPFIKNSLEYDEQRLEIVKAEIDERYSLLVV